MELTITKIGDSFGIILPPDFLERSQLKDGDKVYLHGITRWRPHISP